MAGGVDPIPPETKLDNLHLSMQYEERTLRKISIVCESRFTGRRSSVLQISVCAVLAGEFRKHRLKPALLP